MRLKWTSTVVPGGKACVTAYLLNGLDDEETWRDVGLLTGERAATLHEHVMIPPVIIA